LASQQPTELSLRKQALILESSLNRLAVEADLTLLREQLRRALRPGSMLARGAGLASWLTPFAGSVMAGGLSTFKSGWLGRLGTAVQLGLAAAGWWRRFRSKSKAARD
jgi:hypothetical protein